MKEIISVPNAARTFEALRNLGYDLNSAIADVVDNAITDKVSAKNIAISLTLDSKENIVCRIQDDGCGMNSSELEEAMRLGTETSYKNDDLGKFGMGMKTASLSQCDLLTVISKKERSNICGYRWDISKINKTGKWTLLQLTDKEVNELIKKMEINMYKQGTIVIWDELFKINSDFKSYKSPKFAENYFYHLISELRLYLGMTYHRFLDGTLSQETSIAIRINNEKLEPWDPFCRSELGTEKIILKKELSEFIIPGFQEPVRISGYVLPFKEEFSSDDAWKKAKGLLSWNDSQGYYIYRANRIIRFGGWHGTRSKDEHEKLARIGIDIDPSLDEEFKITVNKTKVQFPEILFNHLKNNLNRLITKRAKAKYDKTENKIKINNSFRKNSEKVGHVSKGLINENKIKTRIYDNTENDQIEVQNPGGTWLANKINDFLKYGSDKDYEIISDNLENGDLWKIVCSKDDKFKVIVNASHPFHSKIYNVSSNKAITGALDALIFSLAFAELYNKNNQNAHLFDTFKSVCSKALERLTEEEVI